MSERHPIPEVMQDAGVMEQLRDTRIHLAMLWDQVWWMALPEGERAKYAAQGFRAPIERFYEDC